ncbi:hypothetical protein [Nostoc sp.]
MNVTKSLPFKLRQSEYEQINDYAGHEIRIVRPTGFEGFEELKEADLVSVHGGIYEVSEIFADNLDEFVLRLIWLGGE